MAGHANEMNHLDNRLLEIQRRLTDMLIVLKPKKKNPHGYKKDRLDYDK